MPRSSQKLTNDTLKSIFRRRRGETYDSLLTDGFFFRPSDTLSTPTIPPVPEIPAALLEAAAKRIHIPNRPLPTTTITTSAKAGPAQTPTIARAERLPTPSANLFTASPVLGYGPLSSHPISTTAFARLQPKASHQPLLTPRTPHPAAANNPLSPNPTSHAPKTRQPHALCAIKSQPALRRGADVGAGAGIGRGGMMRFANSSAVDLGARRWGVIGAEGGLRGWGGEGMEGEFGGYEEGYGEDTGAGAGERGFEDVVGMEGEGEGEGRDRVEVGVARAVAGVKAVLANGRVVRRVLRR